MTVPIVHDLAVQYPDLEITMLSRAMAKPLFERLPSNVHFVGADLDGAHKGLRGLNRLLREIHFKEFDYVADFHNVIRTQWLRLVCHLFGKRVAYAHKGRWGKWAMTRKHFKRLKQQPSVFERHALVLERLGLPVRPVFKSLNYSDLCETSKPQGERWIGIAPFAKYPAKTYPLEKTTQIIEALLQKERNVVYLFGGGDEERQWIAHSCSLNPRLKAAISQHGLAGELALMSQLDVMLSMDSANMHLASLVGTKVVSIWGGTHPYAGFLGWNQKPELCVQVPVPCRPCSVYGNKTCHFKDYECMNEIHVDQVVESLRRTLK